MPFLLDDTFFSSEIARINKRIAENRRFFWLDVVFGVTLAAINIARQRFLLAALWIGVYFILGWFLRNTTLEYKKTLELIEHERARNQRAVDMYNRMTLMLDDEEEDLPDL